MAVSLRQAIACIGGPDQPSSVLRDFFGFLEGRPVGLGTVSVRRQIEALRGRHIHLDVIVVVPEEFSTGDFLDLAFGIQDARDIYATVGLGIGRIRYHEIDRGQADGAEVVTSKSEAKRLTRRFRGSSDDAMDVFVVPEYNVVSGGSNKAGICAIIGCNKDLYAFNGCVIGIRNNTGPVSGPRMGQLLAHELGHGLGLAHKKPSDNLMNKEGTGTLLTSRQGRVMRRDCFVQDGCSI